MQGNDRAQLLLLKLLALLICLRLGLLQLLLKLHLSQRRDQQLRGNVHLLLRLLLLLKAASCQSTCDVMC